MECSILGSEYVYLRVANELIEVLRYKLGLFGIPINGACDVFCDNKSVVTNSRVTSSAINKRQNTTCYHKVREAHVAGTIKVGSIEGKLNISALFTKTMMSGNDRHGMA